MGIAYNPSIVTNGLVLCLDAGNTKSVPRNNILSTWTDYGGNQANYEILGDYSIKLKNTSTSWVGYYPATVSSVGKYIITFTYYSDSNGSSLVLDNDGIMDNTYNTTLTANTTPQTYTGSVDVNTTGNILHFFRRGSGGNIFVTNVSYFKLETTWTDLSGNGNNFTIDASGFTYNSAGYFSMADGGISKLGTMNTSSTCTCVFWIKTTDTQSLFWGSLDNGAYYLGAYRVGNKFYNNLCGSPTFFMDTVSKANIYDNLLDNQWHMVEFKSVDFSAWTNYTFNKYSQYTFGNGAIACISIYNRNLTESESKQNFNATRSRFGI